MERGIQGSFLDARLLSSACFYEGQNSEELRRLVFCMSMELESVRSAAKDEIKRQEENARQLMQMLKMAFQERDEAREQCFKLQEKLLVQKGLSEIHSALSNSHKGDSTVTESDSISGTYKHHSFVSSPGQSMFDAVSSLHESSRPNNTIGDSTGMDLLQPPYFDLPEEYHQPQFPVSNIQSMQLCGVERNETSKYMRNSSSISNFTYLTDDLQNIESQPIFHSSPSFPENNNVQSQSQALNHSPVLMKVSSCVSENKEMLDFQKQISGKNIKQQAAEQVDTVKGNLQDQDLPHKASQNKENLVGSEKSTDSKEINQINAQSEALLQVGNQVNAFEQINAPSHESLANEGAKVTTNSLIVGTNIPNSLVGGSNITTVGSQPNFSVTMSGAFPESGNVMSNAMSIKRYMEPPSCNKIPEHLPEPPEADPQVIMKSLPERGRLLEAVMSAGPLLQTLLLAGPLPQWRHPPPPLESFEIPLVSMPTTPAINPLPCPSPISAPMKNGASLATSYNLTSQKNISQAQMASLLQFATPNTSPNPNKRALIHSSNGGHFSHDSRPPSKLAKLV